ncbi:MAG TPA: glycosyltransferase family 4 protein [Candidatus Saccharimonadales bacterium]
MSTLRIAFVLDDSLDKTDGVQQYVLTLGQWLAKQGHDVHYIVGETKRTDIPNIHSLARNIKVRFNRNRMSIPLPVSRRVIRRLLSQQEFDIIHVQMPYSPALGGRVIQEAGPLTGVVATFHIAPHSGFVKFANRLLRFITFRSFRRIDEIISVSQVAQDFAWDAYRTESAVVPNTLRLTPFYNPSPIDQYKDTVNVVFLGRLVDRKGCQYLLRAIRRIFEAKMLPADSKVKVVICGTGPLENELKTYVKTHRMSHLVDFVGFISEEDKPNYLACADIAVYPSTGGESFGIVLLEAMAASRGVVLAGNNPGYASVMGERPEVLFDPLDDEQLANKIQRYLDSKNERLAARDYQRQFVRKFDVPNVADEILVVYDEALHKRRS